MLKKISKNYLLFLVLAILIFCGAFNKTLTFISIIMSFIISYIIAKKSYKTKDYTVCVGIICMLVFQNFLIGTGAHIASNSDLSLKYLTQIPFITIFTIWINIILSYISEGKFHFEKSKTWFVLLICCIAFAMVINRGNIQSVLINIRNLTVFFMAYEIAKEYIDFSKVEKILNSERIKTRDYLKSSLDLSSSVKHINICDSNCCGCGACLNICPKGAISMKKDKAGFIYPCIDKDKCINCGLCEKVCNYRKQSENDNNHIVKSYASCTLNKDIIINSASGGIFAQIASNILKNDGIVYGAALEKIDDIWVCHHKRVNDLKGLTQLQGSKYVQSNIENTYSLAKQDLNDGKTVLFSGTPCQISGLYGYLNGKKYDNLYTIDIICHGVPSNDLFDKYLSFLENKYKKKITDFKFRDKSKNWGQYYFKISFEDKSFKSLQAYKSSYYQLFLNSETCRENCYSCPYSNLKRPGNISIGDYWGISEEYPEYIEDKKIDEKYGISCLIVNNTHGNELIEKFGDNLSMLDSNVQKIVKHNHQLSHPSIPKGNRKKVYNLLENHCYDELSSYYKKRYFIKNIIKKVIKR